MRIVSRRRCYQAGRLAVYKFTGNQDVGLGGQVCNFRSRHVVGQVSQNAMASPFSGARLKARPGRWSYVPGAGLALSDGQPGTDSWVLWQARLLL